MDEWTVRVAALLNKPAPSGASLAKNYQIASFTPSRILKLFVRNARRDSVTSHGGTMPLWSDPVLLHATLYFIGHRSNCSEVVRQAKYMVANTGRNIGRQQNPSNFIIS